MKAERGQSDDILGRINAPEDIKKLSSAEIEHLAAEIREFIIETVAKNGGHLAPSLGVVELTLALYSVFSFPDDKLIWDVGHQAYAHKILTGRRDAFSTLRMKGGITGFPNRIESPYDAFGVGHASTSISAALGYAVSRDLQGGKSHVIAVIGDGALTGGEAYEGLNHAGDLGKRLIVIINDNHMSIDKNVGAMNEYLARFRIAPEYQRAKSDISSLLKSIPHIGETVYKTASHIKDGVRAALVEGNFFEDIGFRYIGPIDGHNIHLMTEVFLRAKEMEVFSKTLIDLAKVNEKIVAITAAMPSGTGLKAFGKVYPSRFFDTGIAEEHAMTFAAGMAADGLHPVIALYSTFAQRAFDQMIHDVCLQNLSVTIALDRAGLVGEDGPTHHGVFDLSYLRMMPNMTVFVPKDEEELRHMLAAAVKMDVPTAIRYPRSAGLGVPLTHIYKEISIGKAEILRRGRDVSLLALGTMVETARKAADILEASGISAEVVNMRFLKPIDTVCILQAAKKTGYIVTLEENVLAGGFGSAVAETLADVGTLAKLLRIGLPDAFIEQGTRAEELTALGMDPASVAKKIEKFLNEQLPNQS